MPAFRVQGEQQDRSGSGWSGAWGALGECWGGWGGSGGGVPIIIAAGVAAVMAGLVKWAAGGARTVLPATGGAGCEQCRAGGAGCGAAVARALTHVGDQDGDSMLPKGHLCTYPLSPLLSKHMCPSHHPMSSWSSVELLCWTVAHGQRKWVLISKNLF